MKKRNTLLIVILLVAILLLSVGYASASNILLYINGNANAKAIVKEDPNKDKANNDFKVVFDKKIPKTNGGIVSAIITGDTKANLSAILNESYAIGESYAVFKVKNNSPELTADIDVKFESKDEITEQYFDLYSEVEKSILLPGEQSEVKVFVDLKEVPIIKKVGSFKVKITASPKGV